ncbi:MAG: family 10 glycosylhydrolase [Verrucomicrobiota bacterium]
MLRKVGSFSLILAFAGLPMQPVQGKDIALTSLPPPIRREFRGAWVATVANIDWPSKPALSVAQQQKELLAILDRAAQLKLNAIIFQVRPACDALYASKLEPWSEYLTGQMGRPPAPFYDPLAFAVTQAHERGLELHAWFNPFRARHPSGKSTVAANHISHSRPGLVRSYGRQLWLDPGEKDVQEHSLAVILDVARRYDVDGVHLDDYFYPYQEKDASGKMLDFPDDRSWKNYVAGGGKLSRADWRRENVHRFIKTLHDRIKAEKPWVKVGLSPFGIWRPGFPKQIKGFDAYEGIYADSKQWLANGWLDYFAPQLYWAIAPPEQSFSALLKWWADENKRSRHLWPGIASTKVGGAWRPEEIFQQIQISRQLSNGHIYWNMGSLMRNKAGWADLLAQAVYAEPALVPASPWLDDKPPGKPQFTLTNAAVSGEATIHWQPTGEEKPWLWLVQTKTAGQWRTEILPGNRTVKPNEAVRVLPEVVAVTAVDRCGNASPTALLELKKTVQTPAGR